MLVGGCDLFPKLGQYTFNPFVNDEYGMCCWMTESNLINGSNDPRKIYYNTDVNNYEFGFGEDIPSYNGFYFNVGYKDDTFNLARFEGVYSSEDAEADSTLYNIRSTVIQQLNPEARRNSSKQCFKRYISD